MAVAQAGSRYSTFPCFMECWRIQNRRHHSDGAVAVTIGAVALRCWGRTQTLRETRARRLYWRVGNSGGGAAPPTPNTGNDGCGGNGAGGIGYFTTDTTYTLDARGGLESMAAGGGGGSGNLRRIFALTRSRWRWEHGAYSVGGAAANCHRRRRKHRFRWRSGIKRLQHRNKTSGAGGSGWCRIVWFE